MNILVRKSDSVCVFVSEHPFMLNSDSVKVSEKNFIGFLNKDTAITYEADLPDDYEDMKYCYANDSWTISPDWIDPSEVEPSGEEPAA